MFGFAKKSASKSSQFLSRGFELEGLEHRQMMSASVGHGAVSGAHQAHLATPAIHATTHVTGKLISEVGGNSAQPAVNGSVVRWQDYSAWPLFAQGGPSPADIQQGAAGDCWFLATLAEVALKDPNAIRHDISQLSNGTYNVTFHKNGQVQSFNVDGMLPEDHYGQLVYAGVGFNGCVWVPIMEKALTYFLSYNSGWHTFAGVIGGSSPSYNIPGGFGTDALQDLGASNITPMLSSITLPGVGTIWQSINSSQLFSQVGAALAAGKGVEFGTNAFVNGPLVNSHEYSVIGVRTLITRLSRTTLRFTQQIEVRNPWGDNPGFVANTSTYGSANNGYMWVNASAVLPELDEVVSASV